MASKGKGGGKAPPAAPPAAASAAAPPKGLTKQDPLPSKEASVYRDMLKNYDEKNFKKAVKLGDGILKKHPGHGETLAMKGLCTFYLPGRKAEAYALVKEGITHDMKCVAAAGGGARRGGGGGGA